MNTWSDTYKLAIITLLTSGCLIALLLMPPIAQDLHYHCFADGRTLLGIPNFWNVLSNLPFVIIGIAGIRGLKEYPTTWSMGGFYTGVFLTGFGSAYYHWQPDNERLIWDRLPMTITFMSLLSAIISIHVHKHWGKKILFPLIALGLLSVGYWYYTELIGHGDLRPYAFVQFYPVLIIPVLILLYPKKGTALILLPMIVCYAIAKYFEYSDHDLYSFGQVISGHTLKHLFAATAVIPAFWLRRHDESKLQILTHSN